MFEDVECGDYDKTEQMYGLICSYTGQIYQLVHLHMHWFTCCYRLYNLLEYSKNEELISAVPRENHYYRMRYISTQISRRSPHRLIRADAFRLREKEV